MNLLPLKNFPKPDLRSEEHTSELHHSSISYAVFCLKKKKIIKYLPPIFSPFSWSLRSGVLRDIAVARFVYYTGDQAVWIVLRFSHLLSFQATRIALFQ